MAILEVQNIRKSFGSTLVLDDISFSMEKGSVLSLIGSSGSGKTTLLRCLNFLEKPDAGIIRVNGKRSWTLPPPLRTARRISGSNASISGSSSSPSTSFPSTPPWKT